MTLTYFSIKSRSPTSRDPTGAPSPLLRQTETDAQSFTRRDAGTLWYTAALKIRAPSQWSGIFRFDKIEPICEENKITRLLFFID